MTISNPQNFIYAQGNSAAYQFQFPFIAGVASNINVYTINSEGVYTLLPRNQYTLLINPTLPNNLWGIGGTVTYPLSGSPIASNTQLLIQRLVPFTQQTSIRNQGAFYEDAIEQALDTLCMQIQELAARTGQMRGIWITDTQYNYGDITTDGVNGADTGNLYMCASANLSGVWATDLANGLWTLALNVQAIVNALPSIANNTVFGNISGSTGTPAGVGVSALLDSVFGNTQGSILYRSGSVWSLLPPGSSGQVLESGGSAANPAWGSAAGAGTITGVTTNNGLTGGGTTGSVNVGLANVADSSLLANTTGGASYPIATTLSAYIDHAISNTHGAILYRNGTIWTALAPGNAGQVLESGGAAANPSWGATTGSGNVVLATSPTLITPALGTPASGNLSNCTNVPVSLMTALAVGSVIFASTNNGGSAAGAGASIAASGLTAVVYDLTTSAWISSPSSLSGTWQFLMGLSVTSHPTVIPFQRIA